MRVRWVAVDVDPHHELDGAAGLERVLDPGVDSFGSTKWLPFASTARFA
jgi:hypothetical protein